MYKSGRNCKLNPSIKEESVMNRTILGIDIAKAKFDVVLLHSGKEAHKVFDNTPSGLQQLQEWLAAKGVKECHACMEATGPYGDNVALFLYQAGYWVSVVNPARIKAYGKSEGVRTKTDKADAGVIARFCKVHEPSLWAPRDPAYQRLRELYRCLQNLKADERRVLNRLEKLKEDENTIRQMWQTLAQTLADNIKAIKKEMQEVIKDTPDLRHDRDLMTTIPAISDLTATAILAEVPDIKQFTNARQLAAYAGLTPSERCSGTSVKGKTRLSKMGSSSLRKALFMPALVAQRHNPVIQDLCKRLKKKGKPPMAIIGAVMRKLLHIIYGVLKSGQPFNEKLHLKRA
jgi:transposase